MAISNMFNSNLKHNKLNKENFKKKWNLKLCKNDRTQNYKMKTTIYDINKYDDNFYFKDQNTLQIKREYLY